MYEESIYRGWKLEERGDYSKHTYRYTRKVSIEVGSLKRGGIIANILIGIRGKYL